MSALVKLPTTSTIGSYLGIPAEGKGLFKATRDSMGLRSHAQAFSVDDEPMDMSEIKLNQTIKLVPPVPLSPRRYTLMLSFNPKLSLYGTVNCPSIVSGSDVFMTFKASKNCNLAELEYIFTYYMID